MKREEAIKLIKHIRIAFVPTDQYGDYDDPQPYEEALDMAIEALKSKTLSGDLISRSDAIERFCELGTLLERQGKTVITMVDAKYAFIETLESLTSAEPKTMDKTNANKIYNYLKEQIGDTVDDMKEFDSWFERMVWHVKECNRLTAGPKTGE